MAAAPTSEPEVTTQDMVNEIMWLKARVEGLTLGTRDKEESRIKINPPQAYDGSPGTLQGFITQLTAYHRYNIRDFPDSERKILHAANLLKGDALSWFEPTLRDYLENNEDERDEDTKKTFKSFANFTNSLKKTFRDPDKTREA
jgi:hypothetical protein